MFKTLLKLALSIGVSIGVVALLLRMVSTGLVASSCRLGVFVWNSA